jgi:hypothetical protein
MKPAVGEIHELPLPQVLEIEKIAYHTWIQQRRIRGLNPPPLGGLFLGWGLNPHPKNLAFNFQLSTFNFQLFNGRLHANS